MIEEGESAVDAVGGFAMIAESHVCEPEVVEVGAIYGMIVFEPGLEGVEGALKKFGGEGGILREGEFTEFVEDFGLAAGHAGGLGV